MCLYILCVCMNMCLYICLYYVCVHVWIYTHTHTYIHTYMHTHVCISVLGRTCAVLPVGRENLLLGVKGWIVQTAINLSWDGLWKGSTVECSKMWVAWLGGQQLTITRHSLSTRWCLWQEHYRQENQSYSQKEYQFQYKVLSSQLWKCFAVFSLAPGC